MLVDNCAADVAHVLIAHTAVVAALWLRIAALREAEDPAAFFEEIFLLEAEPCTLVIKDIGAGVGWVSGAVWKHDFAHDEEAVLTGAVRIESYRFEDAVRVTTFSLLSGGTIEAPFRELLESGCCIKFLDAAFGAEIWNGRVAVQPDVIESVFSHWSN